LVKELLDVSTIQAGKLALHLEAVDLVALAQEVAERFEEELAQARSPLRWRLEGPVVGTWDRDRLDQVVTNLLMNAMKFGAGKPIEVCITARHGKARLVVADQGIGIVPDRLPHIFSRFERGVSVRSYGGLGLGLYIAHQIVEAHGGSIGVESTPGRGSIFTVEFPCQRLNSSPALEASGKSWAPRRTLARDMSTHQHHGPKAKGSAMLHVCRRSLRHEPLNGGVILSSVKTRSAE
jgi:signal transduction histidine kinase